MYKREYLYARVSTPGQDTLSQRPALLDWARSNAPDAGYLEDIGTGKNMARKGIQTIQAGIRAGMTKRVVVVSVNRVGRSTRQVCEFVDLCVENGVSLVSLREGVDLSTPMGRLLVQLLACLAELENEQRSDATKAGLAAARERARKEGRPWRTGDRSRGYSLKVTAEKGKAIKALKEQGLSYRKIAAAVGLSDKTVRTVCLNPRTEYVTRTEAARRRRQQRGE